MKEERITQEEGGIYVSKFTLNEPKHKIFEAGYEESEVDLRVELDVYKRQSFPCLKHFVSSRETKCFK